MILEDLQSSRKRFGLEHHEGDYAGVEVSRKEGKKKLSAICVEVMVQGTRGNEGTERSGVHDEE